MVQRHHIFDELDASLGAFAPREPVELAGSWLPTTRRTYEGEHQGGTGSGPFVEVADFRWRGTLACDVAIAAIAFLTTPTELLWSKSLPAVTPLSVEVSLHAYADHSMDRATFVAGIGGATLPGIAVPYSGDPAVDCQLGKSHLTTGRVDLIAQTKTAAVWAVLLPGQFLKVGRHRLWRVREEWAPQLPPAVRELLTRRRSGSIPLVFRR